jgi:hypothetical protein
MRWCSDAGRSTDIEVDTTSTRENSGGTIEHSLGSHDYFSPRSLEQPEPNLHHCTLQEPQVHRTD